MSATRKSKQTSPLADDLESLLEVEQQLEQSLADAREHAARMIDHARALADSAAEDHAANAEQTRSRIRDEIAERARRDIERLEHDAAASLARLHAVTNRRLAAIVDEVCERFVRSLCERSSP